MKKKRSRRGKKRKSVIDKSLLTSTPESRAQLRQEWRKRPMRNDDDLWAAVIR